MNCLRCEKETGNEQVFCDDCLQVMKKYPVKPDTVIQLPRRKEEAPVKKQPHRKRPLTPEEQVVQLKKLLRRVIACAFVLLLVLGLATALLVREIKKDATPQQPMGRNYTITTDQTNGMFHVEH